jgi:hypothetical protein
MNLATSKYPVDAFFASGVGCNGVMLLLEPSIMVAFIHQALKI